MNLKEALKLGRLEQFAKEHEIEDPRPDNWARFQRLFELMASGKPASEAASDVEPSEDYDETRTHPNSSKDISG